jgi:hypothetical protein
MLVLAACGGEGERRPPPPVTRAPVDAAAAPRAAGCKPVDFVASIPVAEASGAVVLDDGVLVVGDSGTSGAYVIVDPASGALIEEGRLPLGRGAGDDLEGLSRLGDQIVGVTSSGWMRHWRRRPGGFDLVDGPYPIDEPGPMICEHAADVNCGKNYEALCPGWIGSKDEGRLYPIEPDRARLRVRRDGAVQVTGPEVLAGCDVDAAGAVWVGTNLFDGDVYRVAGEQVSPTGIVAGVSTETLVVIGDEVTLFGDLGRAPSDVERYRCPTR